MADLLASGAAWLAGVLAQHAATTATYRRGVLSAAVEATIGAPVEAPYGGNTAPAVVRTAYLPAASLVLGGMRATPASGDSLEWYEGSVLNVITLGPWGPNRQPFTAPDSATYQVFGMPVGRHGLSGRKGTLVELQRPTTPSRNPYGENARGSFETAATVYAELEPLAAGETEDAGRLLASAIWRVFVNTTQPVTAAWRVKVTSGPLTGRYLSIQSVTPLPGYGNELMLGCTLTG